MDQKKLAIVLSSVLVVALVGAFLMLNRRSASVLETSPENNLAEEPSLTSSNAPAATVEGWKAYQNSEFNFSASIPQDVKVLEENSAGDYGCQVYFGKQIKPKDGHDEEWAILVYNKSRYTADKLISEAGSQFGADRKEERENVTVNGLPGVKAVVTASTQPDWRFEAVFLEKGEYVYEIRSGAVKDDNYDKFYNSFKLAE